MASAAVQSEWMAGLCLPMTTSCLPTALILHRGPLIWLLLILSLSFSPSFSSSLHLSVSQICLPWPRRSSWRRWPVTTATSNMAGQTERTVTTTPDWVSPVPHAAARATRRDVVVCAHLRHRVDAARAAVFTCGRWTELIKARMWHHLCCLNVSFERRWAKNKLQQQWVSSSDGITNRHLGQVIQTWGPDFSTYLLWTIFLPLFFLCVCVFFRLW